jgi:N-acyl-L-homoserine lactone synthetase
MAICSLETFIEETNLARSSKTVCVLFGKALNGLGFDRFCYSVITAHPSLGLDEPYMLDEVFPHPVSKIEIPKSTKAWERSRFCAGASLDPRMRERIVQEVVASYLEVGLAQGIANIVGVMYPACHRNIFFGNGWDVERIGDVSKSEEGHKVIALALAISEAVLKKAMEKTGIHKTVLNYGEIVPSYDERFRVLRAA